MNGINPLLLLQNWTTYTPGVSLNSPSNAGTVNSLNPNLTFTGQSATGDQDLTYELQIDTVNTFNSQNGTATITAMTWGGGGGGASNVTYGGGGSGGGFSQGNVTISHGTGYTVVVGGGGAATTSGGQSYFNNTSTVMANGGIGATTTAGASAPSAGVGSITYVGGAGGSGASGNFTGAGGGGGAGSGGNGTAGTDAGNGIQGQGGAGGTPDGGIGGNGGSSGGGFAGSIPGGAGGGNGTTGTSAGGAGARGQVIIKAPVGRIVSATGGTYSTDGIYDYWTFTANGTWTPTVTGPLYDEWSYKDGGFTDVTNGAQVDPFPSGDQIQYAVGTAATPTVSTVTPTTFTTSVTAMPVAMPSTVISGNLLLAFAELQNSGTWTVPSGWNQFTGQVGGGSTGQLTAFWKIADGTEGGTSPTFTSSSASTASWQVRRVTGWHGSASPEMVSTNGDNSNADPSSITPSWGSANNIYIAVAGHASLSAAAFTAGPSGYSDFTNSGQSTGGSSTSTASAYKIATSSSEDPGAFTAGGSNRYWATYTIAIRPQASYSLTDHTTYYWRVRTVGLTNNVSISTSWSSIHSFTVSTAPQYTRSHTTDVYKRRQFSISHTTSTYIRSKYNYTRAGAASVPTTNTDLANSFTSSDISTVASDDSTYVDQSGSAYLLFEFKYEHTNSSNAITVTWNGKASRAPSSNTVYLQIWNYNTSAWETLQSNNTASANTDFTLTGTKTSSLSNYYSSNIVTARVYQ